MNEANLTEREIDFINGALLGDGCIQRATEYSGYFSYNSSVFTHVEYVFNELERLKTKNFTNGPKKYFYFDKRCKVERFIYLFSTYTCKEFGSLREKWYPDNKKKIPSDLRISSYSCLIWYLGDGGLINTKDGRTACIRLSTHDFEKTDLEKVIIPQMTGFGAYIKREREGQYSLIIPRRFIEKFYNYIGDCPVEEYKYKWEARPYKNKKIEKFGIKFHTDLYPQAVEDWNSGKIKTIKELSEKHKIPIDLLKRYFYEHGIEYDKFINKKAVRQLDLNRQIVNIWETGKEAARALGLTPSSISIRCNNYRSDPYKGFYWEFAEKAP